MWIRIAGFEVRRSLTRLLELIVVFVVMFLLFGPAVALVATAIMVIIVALAVKYLGERKELED